MLIVRRAIVLLASLLVLSSAAQAQLFRAYLSAGGSDANPCTLPAPCRLLPAALNAVASGGEIWMLDSANYNIDSVFVTKSVTILAVPGTVGSLVSAEQAAMRIETPDVEVTLRNLVLVGMPGAAFARGIAMTAGKSLLLDGCKLSGFTGFAIDVNTAARVGVNDTTFFRNATGLRARAGAFATVTRSTFTGHTGTALQVLAESSGHITRAGVLESTFEANSAGIHAWSYVANAKADISIRSSLFSGNGTSVAATANAEGPASVTLANSTIAGSTTALQGSGTAARLVVIGNTVTGNLYGYYCNDGSTCYRSGNHVRDNGTNQIGNVVATTPD